jgi:hypothetical protein
MVVPSVRGSADPDLTWSCARWVWGAHKAVWLCCGGEVRYRSRVSTLIRKSNKIAKIPGKFVSPRIESWESHQRMSKMVEWSLLRVARICENSWGYIAMILSHYQGILTSYKLFFIFPQLHWDDSNPVLQLQDMYLTFFSEILATDTLRSNITLQKLLIYNMQGRLTLPLQVWVMNELFKCGLIWTLPRWMRTDVMLQCGSATLCDGRKVNVRGWDRAR